MTSPLTALARILAPGPPSTVARQPNKVPGGLAVVKSINNDGTLTVIFNGATDVIATPHLGTPINVGDTVTLIDMGNQMLAIGKISGSLDQVSGILQIGSKDGTVKVVKGAGPVVDLSAPGDGGYASLTGPGQTSAVGDLAQEGGFTVNAPSTHDIILTGDDGTFLIRTTGTADLSVETTGAGNLLLEANGTGQVLISSPNGIALTAAGIAVNGTFSLEAPTTLINLCTAVDFAGLPTAPTPGGSFGFAEDGHIYFYPIGGPWTLVA